MKKQKSLKCEVKMKKHGCRRLVDLTGDFAKLTNYRQVCFIYGCVFFPKIWRYIIKFVKISHYVGEPITIIIITYQLFNKTMYYNLTIHLFNKIKTHSFFRANFFLHYQNNQNRLKCVIECHVNNQWIYRLMVVLAMRIPYSLVVKYPSNIIFFYSNIVF